MANSDTSNSGFSDHVQQQIHSMTRGRARGRGNNDRGRAHNWQQYHESHGYRASPQTPEPMWNSPATHGPPDINSFPPLGSAGVSPQMSGVSTPSSGHSYDQSRVPTYHSGNRNMQPSARDFFDRARTNGYRGSQHSRGDWQHRGPTRGSHYQSKVDDFRRRPPPPNQTLYPASSHSYPGNSDQQRALRHKIINQSDYLSALASQHVKNSISAEEAQTKEAFRKIIQGIAQGVIAAADPYMVKFAASEVKLRLYGSLGSGFGVSGCDMDLLLAFPHSGEALGDIEITSRRLLEKALLDAGYGARLLTQTRVPILKVCEKPSTELLTSLRTYRQKWEQNMEEAEQDATVDPGFGPLPPSDQTALDVTVQAMDNLNLDAPSIALPPSPKPENVKLEFSGDCGIQCDINFSNYVALHNTELLRIYGQCDQRVRQIGIFVKNWCKARDINTPYRGTLSSYGYILMVLHYVMNVVNPPLIPNLQVIAKDQDAFTADSPVELVEGHDVRFIRDPEQIKQILHTAPRNHESLGSLLRGFFWYFSDRQGFNWSQDVLSLRTRGGQLSKRYKGWTGAKWAGENNNVRNRYLLAIEDPFEIDHNVGRTVGHNGIVAIRNEFRRAWAMIDSVFYDEMARAWFWIDSSSGERKAADDFMEVVQDRGDLLRMDQAAHREKLRRMRQDVEAQEQALRSTSVSTESTTGEFVTNGMFFDEGTISAPGNATPFPTNFWDEKLIHDRSAQAEKRKWTRQPLRRHRQQDLQDSDNEAPAPIKEQLGPNTDQQASLANQRPPNKQTNDLKQDKPRTVPDSAFARHHGVSGRLEAHNRDHSSTQKVGRRIYWDPLTKGGRWLRWRDAQIAAERWSAPGAPVYQILDQLFPYDPGMTYQELHTKNEVLYQHFRDSLEAQPPLPVDQPRAPVPRPQAVMPEHEQSQWQTFTINDAGSRVYHEEDARLGPSMELKHAPVYTKPKEAPLATLAVEAHPQLSLAELRKRRLRYFDMQSRHDSGGTGMYVRFVPASETY